MQAFRNERDEALQFLIQATNSFKPDYLIILGTGLSLLASKIDAAYTISYDAIPHFPLSTVESHHGKLIFGQLGNKKVVAMQGRFHYYEGYAMHKIIFPIRVLHALGVRTLIVSNAAGGLNPLFSKSDIMMLVDHINLLGDNPLIGPNDDELGPRFPDMSEPYTHSLCKLTEEIALQKGINLQKGVYASVSGPNLETRAEYRFLRTIGADAVGMSTIPEVIAANHLSMNVLGFSVITDMGLPDALEKVSIQDVLAAAAQAEPALSELIESVLERL